MLILILSELLEFIFNSFVYQNLTQSVSIRLLNGKIFKVKFLELKYPIILYFDIYHIHIFNAWNDQLNCVIQMKLSDFFSFLMSQWTTQTIDRIPFEIKGDLHTVQDFMQLINKIKFNFLGFFLIDKNKIENKSCCMVRNFLIFFQKKIDNIKFCVNIAITDEWKLIPSLLELRWFYKEICVAKNKEESLLDRVRALEKNDGV